MRGRFRGEAKEKSQRASAGYAGRLRLGYTIDEERRQENRRHHQPPRQIHLSQREICSNKRSHPFHRGILLTIGKGSNYFGAAGPGVESNPGVGVFDFFTAGATTAAFGKVKWTTSMSPGFAASTVR